MTTHEEMVRFCRERDREAGMGYESHLNLWEAIDHLRMKVQWLKPEPHTTAATTPTAPTEAEPSAVAAEPTNLRTDRLLLSDQAGIRSGPVAPGSECAHNFARLGEMRTPQHPELRMLECCMNCDALAWSVRTLVLAADPTSWT